MEFFDNLGSQLSSIGKTEPTVESAVPSMEEIQGNVQEMFAGLGEVLQGLGEFFNQNQTSANVQDVSAGQSVNPDIGRSADLGGGTGRGL